MVHMIVKKKKKRALLETRHLLTTLVEMTDFRGIKEKIRVKTSSLHQLAELFTSGYRFTGINM